MNEQEKKLYILMQDCVQKMTHEYTVESDRSRPVNTISFFGTRFEGFDWQRFKTAWDDRVCRELGAKITSIRRDLMENFYVINPTETFLLGKPTIYFEIKKDIGLKILALGYVP